MANIQEKILSKYDIDVTQENVFKLYKIEKADISEEELQSLINVARRRWEQSINGANEKNAERDKKRLEKADKYEEILKDIKLRKELYAFYNGGGNGKALGNESSANIDFAKEYFNLLSTSKKINNKDVEFFFNYYQNQRKNKKAILEILEQDFKVKGLGKEDKYAEENSDEKPNGKTKNESSPLIVNLFQEATIIRLKKCIELYENILQNNDICKKYPTLKDGLYEFLGLKQLENIQKFSEYISLKSKEMYAVRQEKGSDYIPLVDLFNILQELTDYRDVVDNYSEFTLLIKYPTLTPYMYSFSEMKKNTLKGIINIANRDYAFRDEADFILTYYNPVHDNFGISNSGIEGLIRKAEKKAKTNKLLNNIDEKLGRKKKHKLPITAELIHFSVYWPIFLVYFLFEIFKAIFTRLHKLAIPLFMILFMLLNWPFSETNILPIQNVFYLRKILIKAEWYEYLTSIFGTSISSGAEAFVFSTYIIFATFFIYILPVLIISMFASETAKELNKKYDWVGYKRTFQNILNTIRQKAENDYIANKNMYLKKRISKIIINIVCMIIIALTIYFAPVALQLFSEKTGYFQ